MQNQEMIHALKDACQQVFARTKGMAGTALGSRQLGRGAGGDISRKIDLVAEKTAISVLRKHGVDATIIAEEAGRIEGKNGFVIIDAIDGTTNATRRVPFYCCSIAFATDFKLSAVTNAAIIDLTTGDLYHAAKSKGAFLNGRRIATAISDDLAVSMNISSVRPEIIERLSPVIMKAKHVRQFGSVALEMCYLARGSLDAYIDFRGKVRPTDIAAAYLMVKEAGGRLNSETGTELDSDLEIKTRLSFLAAANEEMLGDLSDILIG